MKTPEPVFTCPLPLAITPMSISSKNNSLKPSPGSCSPKSCSPRSFSSTTCSSTTDGVGGRSPRNTTVAAEELISELGRALETSIKPLKKNWSTHLNVLKLAYQSLGVIYGDMGTSPLYVFSSTFATPPEDKRDVVGALSLIFWTITVIALVKYVTIVLKADDNGEGGTSALYTLLCRHVNISLLISQHKSDTRLKNYKTMQNQSNPVQKQTAAKFKATLESSPRMHKVLLVIVMAGSCMVIGDGILTPAISVLSAVEGIQVVATHLKTNVVLLITCLILIGLFLLQRRGTEKVSGMFTPVILVWLFLIAGIGIYNISAYAPSIFQACSPHYGILFLVRNKKKGWIMLGGVVLSITGTEAMFADLGHFSQRSIQIAFAGLVYPSLVLAYFGQAAYLTVYPENFDHAFFKSTPRPLFWPMLVVATLATIVASQAMISGAFSVIKQSLNLGCFPRVKIVHTSKTVHGQIYIPEVNYALMVLSIAVVLGFKNTSAIGNAYGIAVVSVMFITTCLTTLVIILVWEHHILLGILFLCFFGSIEGVYLCSVLFKVASGGWVPLVIAASLLSVMCVWQYGTLEKYKFDLKHMVSMDHLDELIADSRITRVPGIGFFYTSSDIGIPPTFSHFIDNLPALHQIMVFVCIKYVPVTSVLEEERVFIRKLAVKNFYQTVIRYGYNEDPMAGEDFDNLIINKIAEKIKADGLWNTAILFPQASLPRTSSKTTSPTHSRQLSLSETEMPHVTSGRPNSLRPLPRKESKSQAEIVQELVYLLDAKEKGVVYVVSYSDVQAKAGSRWCKRFLINVAYNALCKYCRSEEIMLNIPTHRLIEVGMIYDL